MDQYLRDGHGTDFVATIRAERPNLSHVPIVLISSDNKIDRSHFSELNIRDYILKPFNSKTLNEKIEAILNPKIVEETPQGDINKAQEIEAKDGEATAPETKP